MNRRFKHGKVPFLWLLGLLVLIILYLLSATDLILKEEGVKAYPVSVLMDGVSDEFHENLKKGMDDAADAYHIDANFKAFSPDGGTEEKAELVFEEIANGAKAVVVGGRFVEEVIERVRRKVKDIPIVALGETGRGAEDHCIYADDEKVSSLLVSEIKKRHSGKEEIVLVRRISRTEKEQRLYAHIINGMKAEGFEISEKVWEPGTEKEVRGKILLLPDKKIGTETLHLLDEKKGSLGVSAVYVIGSTPYLLKKLDEGAVTGMMIRNEYEEGYAAIQMAASVIGQFLGTRKDTVESIFVDREKMFKEEYMGVLYPIN